MINKLIHNRFVKFCEERSISHLVPKAVNRAVEKKAAGDGVEDLGFEDLRVLNKAFPIYPEALAYLFKVEGCTKQLFMYLLIFHVDRGTGEFKFNASIVKEFLDLCKLFGESYKEDSVKQAMKNLRKMNVVLNLKRGLNMVNPMITGGNNEKARQSLIKEYGFQLLQEGKDVINDFYPRYKK
jgi:hypothetical protein